MYFTAVMGFIDGMTLLHQWNINNMLLLFIMGLCYG